MIVERNGAKWSVDSFSDDDCQICKNGNVVAEYTAGTYSISNGSISEEDLGTVTDLVNQFRQNVSK